ncbi:MAG: FHA domain-containing protein, partial [Vulcanimicrobiota bacterium]
GNKVSIMSEEVREGKQITFGSAGDERQNDIEINEPGISNTQGYLEYTQDRLYLINKEDEPIQVNEYEVGKNEKIILNNGDLISMGQTVISFLNNRVIGALRHYSILISFPFQQKEIERIPITKTMLFIGRGSSCDIRILDPEVSRLHAVLTFQEGRFFLEQKSKINPTFVNGISLRRDQSRIIFPGDKIYLSRNTILSLQRTG